MRPGLSPWSRWPPAFDRFLHVEGKSERTRVLYRQSTDYFSRWLEAQDLVADMDNFTPENVLGWLESLRKRELTDGTILTRWRGLRRFTNWLPSEQIVNTDPLAGIAVDKPEAPSAPILTDEELSALLRACNGRSFNDLRDAVVVRLLIDRGLRVSELTGIDLTHLDLDSGCVQVTGKGSRTRMAYFGSRTSLALDRYLRARRCRLDPSRQKRLERLSGWTWNPPTGIWIDA